MSRAKLYPVKAYLDKEEKRLFRSWVQARGVSESAYIREMLSFEVKPRGAPKGHKRGGRAGKRGRKKDDLIVP